jgi:DNA-binding CsgD family transcriptional regulator
VGCLFSALERILECVGFGAALYARDGSIVVRNQLAERIFSVLAENSGRDGYGAKAKLPTALQAALRDQAAKLVVLDIGESRPVIARSMDLGPDCDLSFLMIADLNRVEPSSPAALRLAFNLTEREACITADITAGLTVADISTRDEVGQGTVRGQLKKVLSKTATRRQAELTAVSAILQLFKDSEAKTPHPSDCAGGAAHRNGAAPVDRKRTRSRRTSRANRVAWLARPDR